MKNHLLLLLVFVLFCSLTIDNGLFAKKTDWNVENLFGKVKSVVSDIQTGKSSKITKSKYGFTDYGNYSSIEDYDNFGEKSFTSIFEYNISNQLITLLQFSAPERTTKTVFNYVDNLAIYSCSADVFINDDNIPEKQMIFDDKGSMIKLISKKNRFEERNEIAYKFKYSQSGKILMCRQSDNMGKNKKTRKYKLDKNDNLTKAVVKTFFSKKSKFKTEFKYKNNKLISAKNYINGEINQIIEFDTNRNEILKEVFVNSKITEKLTFEYKFDAQKNWIEKKTFKTDYATEDEQPLLFELETREIVYY